MIKTHDNSITHYKSLGEIIYRPVSNWGSVGPRPPSTHVWRTGGYLLVSHNTDTPIYVFPSTLSLSVYKIDRSHQVVRTQVRDSDTQAHKRRWMSGVCMCVNVLCVRLNKIMSYRWTTPPGTVWVKDDTGSIPVIQFKNISLKDLDRLFQFGLQ